MTIQVKELTLGQGLPKICVPLVSTSPKALLADAARLTPQICDLAEWRADWMESIFEEGQAEALLKELQAVLGPIPLLFTFRTHREGGCRRASREEYTDLTARVIRSGLADLADIELFTGEEEVKSLVAAASGTGTRLVFSNHDFHATPSEEEILKRLKTMEEMGAHIAKIAVTPREPEDVLTLLSATAKARRQLSCPIITMSMKGTGLISRLCGEVFGSCLTFGTLGQASAPGQIDAGELRSLLQVIHKGLEEPS